MRRGFFYALLDPTLVLEKFRSVFTVTLSSSDSSNRFFCIGHGSNNCGNWCMFFLFFAVPCSILCLCS